MKSRRDKIVLGFVVVLFLFLAILFGIYDFHISKTIANMESSFGLALEFLGYVVPPVIVSLAGVVISIYYYKDLDGRRRRLKLTGGLVSILAGLCYCCYEFASLTKLESLVAILTISLLLGIAAAWLLMQGKERLYSLVEISVILICHIIIMLVIVNIIKLFWGRVRYREMTDISDFSQWFLPQGITGHHSFPSGHTSSAAALWGLTLFSDLTSRKWLKVLCYLLPSLWIVLMAFSRVVAGAHYPSDVLFGAAISILLFYLVKWFVKKYWTPDK